MSETTWVPVPSQLKHHQSRLFSLYANSQIANENIFQNVSDRSKISVFMRLKIFFKNILTFLSFLPPKKNKKVPRTFKQTLLARASKVFQKKVKRFHKKHKKYHVPFRGHDDFAHNY